jgi:hypothetical protein
LWPSQCLTSESLSSRRARRALIAVEFAVSVALVLTTGLLIASLVKLMDVDRGFTTEWTITATSICLQSPIAIASIA